MPQIPLSLQLYTVRELTKADLAATVKEVAKIGYKGVELAGFGNLGSAAEVRKALDDVGLKVSGAHISVDRVEQSLNQVLDEAQTLGTRFVVVPWLPEDRRKTVESWLKLGQSLTQAAQSARQRGVEIVYHNHAFEFQPIDGRMGLDILFESTDPALVKSELDVYWVKYGEQDPIAYISKLSNRLPLLHLKDMAPGAERRFAPVGSGILDFKAIIAAGQKANVQWYVVEQDNCYETKPLDAVRTSYENLKKLGFVG